MRQSLMSVIFAAALLFECRTTSAGLPAAKADNDSLELDAVASLLGDEAVESSPGDPEAPAAARSRGPRLIVIAADPSLWRDLRVLHGGVHKRRADDGGPADRRDAAQDLSIPILRRDTMRCMVGRVYRPCWEV